MKFAAALVLLVAAINAFPQSDTKNDIAQTVIDAIQDLSNRIVERGLDPVAINKLDGQFALPSERLFEAAGLVEEVGLVGLSNIIIVNVSYDPISSVVNFDLLMPGVTGSVGLAVGEVVIFGNNFSGLGSGSLAVTGVSANGFVSIEYGADGVQVTSANVNAKVANIESAISLAITTPENNYDLSEQLNNFLGNIVPSKLDEFENQVNELIGIYLVRYLNNRLN